MNTILGQKKQVTQKFLTDGTRIPVTFVQISPNPVTAIKTAEKHGYTALQVGYGINSKPTKAEKGFSKGVSGNVTPRFFREIRVEAAETLPQVGESLTAEAVLKAGDIVDVTGTSKGKGFAGGVKRFHFRGGPRTHGQSDRERAPGSVGQTTTPGRVYKGKRMAGKMGFEHVTVKNLTVVDVDGEYVILKGVIPGIPNSLIKITKVGEKKNFIPIIKPVVETPAEETVTEEAQEVEAPAEEATNVEEPKEQVTE